MLIPKTMMQYPQPHWFLYLLFSPLAQAETRWDRFAKEKGIMGSKRSRNIWDDDMKEWRPRHGFKRANDGVLNHAIVEVKPVSRHDIYVYIVSTVPSMVLRCAY